MKPSVDENPAYKKELTLEEEIELTFGKNPKVSTIVIGTILALGLAGYSFSQINTVIETILSIHYPGDSDKFVDVIRLIYYGGARELDAKHLVYFNDTSRLEP